MLPDNIRLWRKNDRGVWQFYAYVFRLRSYNKASFLQQIARLVRQGWTPYDAKFKTINDNTSPASFDFSSIDTAPLEEYIKNLDPITHYAGVAFKEWVVSRKEPVKEPIVIAPLEQSEDDKALAIATADYLAGKFVPKFMIQRVIESRYSAKPPHKPKA